MGKPNGNHLLIDKGNHSCVGERNCSHLLAPHSPGVEEIHEHRFVFRFGS
jgi:hypothetical protein